MIRRLGVLALACAAAVSQAHAAPAPVDGRARIWRGGVVIDGAVDGQIHLAAAARREKHCRDVATGNSDAAKEKSYRACLKTWR